MSFKQQLSSELKFIIISSCIFGIGSFLFSLTGLITYNKTAFPNPLEDELFFHIIGHLIFGLIVGAISLKRKYIILAAIFPVILDTDHFVYFLQIDGLERASHSLVFGIIIAGVFIIKNKDYLLGSIALSAIFSHIAFDSFRGVGHFPILFPFVDEFIVYEKELWIILEITGIIIVITGTILAKYRNKS